MKDFIEIIESNHAFKSTSDKVNKSRAKRLEDFYGELDHDFEIYACKTDSCYKCLNFKKLGSSEQGYRYFCIKHGDGDNRIRVNSIEKFKMPNQMDGTLISFDVFIDDQFRSSYVFAVRGDYHTVNVELEIYRFLFKRKLKV